MDKYESTIYNGSDKQISRARNQLSTVLDLIQKIDEKRDDKKLVHLLESLDKQYLKNILSSLTHIEWTEKLIEKYKNKWCWHLLSNNAALPWSNELFEKYKDYWRLETLISKEYPISWSIDLVEQRWSHMFEQLKAYL